MHKEDFKNYILVVAGMAGMFWWLDSGQHIIFGKPEYEALLEIYRGYDIVSLQSVFLWLLISTTTVFPVFLWFFLCFSIRAPSMLKELVSFKNFWLFLIPISTPSLLALMFAASALAVQLLAFFWLFYIVFWLLRFVMEVVNRR